MVRIAKRKHVFFENTPSNLMELRRVLHLINKQVSVSFRVEDHNCWDATVMPVAVLDLCGTGAGFHQPLFKGKA